MSVHDSGDAIVVTTPGIERNSARAHRSRERYRRIASAAVASAGARGVSLITSLMVIPLTLSYLGAERYGLWVTINSIVAMLVFADFGIGNGLLNAISEANGTDDHQSAVQYVSSAFFMVFGVAFLFLILFLIVYPLVPWSRVFNTSTPQAGAEAGPAMAAFVLCFLVSMPLGIVQKVQLGLQEGGVSNVWQGIGNICGLAAIFLAIRMKAGLPWLVVGLSGAPLVALALNSIVVFTRKHPEFRPTLSGVTRQGIRKVTHVGILFFVLQIVGSLAYLSDNLIAAHLLGYDAVTQYSVPSQLFRIVPMGLSMVMIPLWPAYGEAIARYDVPWVRRTLVRSAILGIGVNVPAAVFLVSYSDELLHLWVGPTIVPSLSLLMGLGVRAAINGFEGPVAMFLNGANVIWFQVICGLLMLCGNVILKIILTRSFGISGLVWSSVLALTMFFLLPSLFYITRLLKNMKMQFTADEV